MKVPYILIPNSSVSVNVPGQTLTADSSHPNFKKIVETIIDPHGTVDALKDLFDLSSDIRKFLTTSGNLFELKHGVVYHNGEPVNNYVCDKIIQFMESNIPVEPIVNFLDRVMKNPSRRSVTELYRFLEAKSMPITSDGYFRAYKGVRSDYMDIHSGKFSNKIGTVNSMPRNQVDDDAQVGCSYGFHVGTQAYANNWAGSHGRLMVVEVDPADVVSVPYDCNCQKLRTAKYRVVDELHDRGVIQEVYVDTDPDEDLVNSDDTDDFCERCGTEISPDCDGLCDECFDNQ